MKKRTYLKRKGVLGAMGVLTGVAVLGVGIKMAKRSMERAVADMLDTNTAGAIEGAFGTHGGTLHGYQ